MPTGYYGALQNLFAANNPDYGVGVNINIPLRNRVAQADQARSQMEYRQTQMRLQQLYTQIRIQVINGQYALTNDRANVLAAQTARDFEAQSLEAEQKKYKLGASTTANVLTQERNLAGGENNLIAATAAYAKDKSALLQILVDHAGPVRCVAGGCGFGNGDAGAKHSRTDRPAGPGTAEAVDGHTSSAAQLAWRAPCRTAQDTTDQRGSFLQAHALRRGRLLDYCVTYVMRGKFSLRSSRSRIDVRQASLMAGRLQNVVARGKIITQLRRNSLTLAL